MIAIDEIKSNDYFESYDNISVHNLMLRDKPRVSKYREAILASKNLFKDKVCIFKFRVCKFVHIVVTKEMCVRLILR
jgi:hypothetical protein